MDNKLVYLINAGNDEKYRRGVVHGTSFPPLGVVSLATAVKEYTSWKVKVFDGLVTEEKEITESIIKDKPYVVGVSVLSTSYQSALRIAKIGKENGAIIIFGNDQAAITGKNMLRKRKEIDYICTADIGEFCFVKFLQYLEGKISIEEVPKLMYRVYDYIRHNDLAELEGENRFKILDQIPIPDRLLIPEEIRKKYLESYISSYPDEGVTGTGTMNRFRGCSYLKNPCCYCGIIDLEIRASSPEIFWEDIRAAREIGINRIFEAGDSVSSVPKYLKELLDSKPNNLSWNSFVYTSARETTVELVRLYKELGVFRANMGLDSGDNIMLRRLKGKKDSVEQNARAVKLLSNSGIKIYSSFVLGGPGENEESIKNTIEFTRWLINNKLVDGTEAQPLFPQLNAEAGRMLLNPEYAIKKSNQEGWKIRNFSLLYEMPEKWSNHENPDPEEISRDWATIFSEISYEGLLEIAASIRKYSREKGVLTGSSWIVMED